MSSRTFHFLAGVIYMTITLRENWNFITRSIPVERKLLPLNGKLSVRDNQLFMN